MKYTAPAFWWQAEPTATARALTPVARIWGALAERRMLSGPGYRAPIPVVCVGNFVVGGAGKTPTAIALARLARGLGLKPGMLASGYGGAARTPVLVDPAVHTADVVGDEALLLAAAAPTVVSRDRAAGARRLIDENVDIIIMDDGFQNPALALDLALVAVDAASGIGNGLIMPSGPLRLPLTPQMRRADALLVVGDGEAGEPLVRAAARAGRPVLRASIRPVRAKDWRKEPILAYAGIGHPEKFFASLRAAAAPVAKTLSFADHYQYGEVDAAKLLQIADREKLRLVTTEKDSCGSTARRGRSARCASAAKRFTWCSSSRTRRRSAQ